MALRRISGRFTVWSQDMNAGAAKAWRASPGAFAFLCLALGILAAALLSAPSLGKTAAPALFTVLGWVGGLLAAVALAGGSGRAWRETLKGGVAWGAALALAGAFLAVSAEGRVSAAFAPLWPEVWALEGPEPTGGNRMEAGDANFEPRTVAFVGRVVGWPSHREDRTDLVVRVTGPASGWPSPATGGVVLVKVRPPVEGLRHGDSVLVKGALSLPQPPGNPGEFDYRRYLLRRGIGAILYGSGARALPGDSWPDPALPGPKRGDWPVRLAMAVRGRVDRALASSFPAGRNGELALLRGILFGDTSGLPPEVAKDFRDAGVYHILAVSGSNVAFLVASWYELFGACVRRTAWWTGGWAARVRAATALVIVAAYALMTGAGPSVVRASLMAAFWLSGQIAGRKPEVWNSMGLAGAFILATAPATLFDPGFQLSFAATAGIVAWSGPVTRLLPEFQGRWRRMNGYRTMAAATLAAQLATWPVSAYHFGRVPALGLPANLLVVPVSGWLVTGGAAAGLSSLALPLLGRALNRVNFVLGAFLIRWTSAWGALPGASLDVGAPTPVLTVAYYLAVFAAFLGSRPAFSGSVPGGGRQRLRVILVWACLSMTALSIWWGALPSWGTPVLQVTFLDVGQGDAILLRASGGRAALVDTGPPDAASTGGNEQGRLVTLLRRLGVKRLDWILVSHGHDDHDGSLDRCIKAFPVGVVLVSLGPWEAFSEKHPALTRPGLKVRQLQCGQAFAWGHSRVEILWPPPSEGSEGGVGGGGAGDRSNDFSVVARLVYGNTAFLFAGDIGAGTEDILAGWGRAGRVFPRADVLKVSHHGSGTSSGPEFLRLVGAGAAVVSVGRNVFGHPAPETLGRLVEAGAAVWRTDRNGAVTVLTDGRALRVEGFRRDAPCLAVVGQDYPPKPKN